MAKDDADLTVYADKPATRMQEHFADWLLEETGYDPSKAKTKEEAFRAGVTLGAYLRPTFQRSETNHGRREDDRAAKEEASEARAEKRAAKSVPAKAAKAVPAKASKAKAPAATAGKGGPRKASAKPVADADNNSPF